MTTNTLSPPTTERVLAMIRGELSTPRRWFYRAVLLAASVMTAAILSLWMTESGPLPLRLHVAFGALSLIGCAWIGVLTWILWIRRCPTALDQIATGWVATGACALFLVVAVVTAVTRGDQQAAIWLGLIGISFLSVAVMMLCRAYAWREELRRKLAELEGKA